MNKITFLLTNLSTGGASQPLPPTSKFDIKHFWQQKCTATAVLEWLPLPRLNQRHREPCHTSSCGFRLFLLVFLQKSRPLCQTLFAFSATGGASQPLPPTSQFSVKRFEQQKSTATAVLEWLPLLDLNQRHRD